MSKVKFGISTGADPEDDSRGTEYFQKIIHFLDNLDEAYESVWLPDHLIPDVSAMKDNPNEQTYSVDYLECITTTSYLLALFPKLKFGTLVLCNNFRNPALLAKMSSNLQVISDGRFILGLGAGWFPEEHKQYGFEYPKPKARIERLEESIQIIKKMWIEDGVTFHGKHYHVENAYCNPKPDTVPPLLIGGTGEKYTLKLVAKYADWWNGPFLDVDTWSHKLNVLANHCDTVGRDFDDIVKSEQYAVSVADSDEEALRIAKHSQYYSEEFFIVGSPESVISQMGELVDAGVEYFQPVFAQYRFIESTQLFADEVIPELT